MSTTTVYKRADYMDGKIEHDVYYGQFVTPRIREAVLERFGIERLHKALQSDRNLNTIPLHLWGRLGISLIGKETANELKAANDFLSQAGIVCILKVAARQLLEAA